MSRFAAPHAVARDPSRAETERLFAALSEDGTVDHPLQDVFWGDYFGTLTGNFATHWMFNCTAKQ